MILFYGRMVTIYSFLKPCSHLKFAFVFVSTSPSNAQNGFRPILCICVCVSIDTMLNLDGDVDANVKCEHSLTLQDSDPGLIPTATAPPEKVALDVNEIEPRLLLNGHRKLQPYREQYH